MSTDPASMALDNTHNLEMRVRKLEAYVEELCKALIYARNDYHGPSILSDYHQKILNDLKSK